jgi:hypothetical protein
MPSGVGATEIALILFLLMLVPIATDRSWSAQHLDTVAQVPCRHPQIAYGFVTGEARLVQERLVDRLGLRRWRDPEPADEYSAAAPVERHRRRSLTELRVTERDS